MEKKLAQRELIVKGTRSGHVDNAEQAMLEQVTQKLKNFKAQKALRDSSKTLHDTHVSGTEDADSTKDEDLPVANAIRPGPYNRRHSEFNIKDYAYPHRQLLTEFKVRTTRAPDLAWLNDTEGFEEPATARVDAPKRRAHRTTPYVKPCASGPPQTSSGKASSEERCAQSCALLLTPQGRNTAKALLEQFHRHRSSGHRAASIQRRALEGAQLPRAAGVRPFEQKAEEQGGRTWEEYTAAFTWLLQSASRAETLVWRHGDDA
ncbi:hypothetical protein T484DRAFT_1983048 [Baffinella frigidus]|nr:hypothetical protein T484DRAFT_1983048 [Cryptophyta sp. CCMP2293]